MSNDLELAACMRQRQQTGRRPTFCCRRKSVLLLLSKDSSCGCDTAIETRSVHGMNCAHKGRCVAQLQILASSSRWMSQFAATAWL